MKIKIKNTVSTIMEMCFGILRYAPNITPTYSTEAHLVIINRLIDEASNNRSVGCYLPNEQRVQAYDLLCEMASYHIDLPTAINYHQIEIQFTWDYSHPHPDTRSFEKKPNSYFADMWWQFDGKFYLARRSNIDMIARIDNRRWRQRAKNISSLLHLGMHGNLHPHL